MQHEANEVLVLKDCSALHTDQFKGHNNSPLSITIVNCASKRWNRIADRLNQLRCPQLRISDSLLNYHFYYYTNLGNIRVLHLNRCRVTENEFLALITKLVETRSLIEFEFSTNNTKSDGNPSTTIRNFGLVLSRLTNLQKLGMVIKEETFLISSAASKLSTLQCVCENIQGLKDLSIDGIGYCTNQLNLLAGSYPALTTLSISKDAQTKIETELRMTESLSLLSPCQHLSRSAAVTTLDHTDQNNIQALGVVYLARNLLALESLSICKQLDKQAGNYIGQQGALWIAGNLSRLINLIINSNFVPENVLDCVVRGLPALNSLQVADNEIRASQVNNLQKRLEPRQIYITH